MNNSIRILIDADACPVYRIAERIAKENHIPVILFSDTNHVLTSDYSEIRVIGAGTDAVDFALINASKAGDIIITQDYGVAAMALGKGAWAIHQSGKWYTNDNIDQMLMERHLAKKARIRRRMKEGGQFIVPVDYGEDGRLQVQIMQVDGRKWLPAFTGFKE
jgi:uncharacterized protein YaiI (UPF0178 family)